MQTSESLNPGFVRMVSDLGFPELADVLTVTEPSVSIRLNPAKVAEPAIATPAVRVAWEPYGFYLADRPKFTFDPALHQGLYYVQDASSMILGETIRRIVVSTDDFGRPLRYLDLCAAPGGKTTAAIANLPDDSIVVANEYERERVNPLVDNIERWGNPNVIVTRGNGLLAAKLPETFDIVATDVPCSGEGMMRKNLTAVAQWSPELVRQCAALQRELVEAAVRALRPGGYLIYSTCTFNTVENEENTLYIRDELGLEPIDLQLADYPGVTGPVNCDIPAARFIPGRIDGEGLFISVFRKPGLPSGKNVKQRHKPERQKPWPVLREISDWILPGYRLSLSATDTIACATEDVNELAGRLAKAGFNVVRAGVNVATLKGNKPIPTQALATSDILRSDAFPTSEVNYADAITFLRGEALRLPDNTPRGHVLLTYRDHPLGFVKNLGSRANNLLPPPLRIKSPHTPDTPPSIL